MPIKIFEGKLAFAYSASTEKGAGTEKPIS